MTIPSDERLTPERLAACERIINERFQAGEYDYVGRDLLAEVRRLRAQPGRGLLLMVAEAVRDATVQTEARGTSAAALDLAAIVDAIAPETEIERAERAFAAAAEAWVPIWDRGVESEMDDAESRMRSALTALRRAREAAGRVVASNSSLGTRSAAKSASRCSRTARSQTRRRGQRMREPSRPRKPRMMLSSPVCGRRSDHERTFRVGVRYAAC